jgi:hypothetical protein
MAGEQTSYVGDDIKVLVNVIDSTGSHVAATINTSTTRLNGFSTVPTVNTIGTGIYEVVFASVTPAPAEGDRLIAKINGDISGTAWSEYAVPIKIVADERGTDSVVVPTSDITAIKTKTDQLTFTVANQVDANSLTGGTSPADIYTYFTTGTNEDAFKADTSTLATAASIAALNDFNPATDTVANVTTVGSVTNPVATDAATNPVATDAASRTASQADVSALATAASIAALNDLSSTDVTNAVWDASTSSHNVAGSFGRGFRQVKEGLVSIDGQVNDLSATTTSFISNLASAVDDFYNDQTIHFISGSLTGQSRVVVDYNGTTKAITVDQALTSAPTNGDEFIILSNHVHSVAEIVDAVWSEDQSSYTTAGSFGYYLDAQVSAAGVTPPTAAQIADAVWDEVRSPDHVTEGTFGYYVDAQVSSAGAGGSGLYQVTVNVQNQSAQALQGARINVDGTTLTLVTDSAGQCVFNLDSGVYLLTISPPAGYDTVSGNTVTVVTSDISSTFTLTATSSASCDVPWIG